jgi:hypothetical protein
MYDATVVTGQPNVVSAEEPPWVLLAYRLPREPSTPRIAVWRRLKRLGVAQLLDGLVALPLDARNREQLEWIADDVAEAGGQATMWIGRLASRADERSIVRDLVDAVAVEYRKVIDEARAAGDLEDVVRRRTLARLRRELRRIRQRDYFPPPEAQQARAAVEALAALEEVRA